MSIYRELVIEDSAKKRKHGTAEIPFRSSAKTATVLNGIQQGKYYTITGRDSSGKRSFVDLHFLFGAFLWWLEAPEPKPKLKILYFNMNKPLKGKLQKWLCTYLWIYFNRLMDTNTLNGANGRMYDVDAACERDIHSSDAFFDYLMRESDILEIFDGPLNPTGIYNAVTGYMKKVGGIRKDGYTSDFVYDPGFQEQITIVIVDSVRHLKNESKGGSFYDDNMLHQKMNEYMVELRDTYKVTPVLVIPSFSVPGVYKLNQMKPDFREARYYYEDCNVALHLTNPFKLQMESYEGYQMKDFMSEFDAIARFRLLSIMRNTDGRDSLQIPLWFMPENGMIFDLPRRDDPAVTEVTDYIKTFKQLQIQANS